MLLLFSWLLLLDSCLSFPLLDFFFLDPNKAYFSPHQSSSDGLSMLQLKSLLFNGVFPDPCQPRLPPSLKFCEA